jgi:hypothetical protein
MRRLRQQPYKAHGDRRVGRHGAAPMNIKYFKVRRLVAAWPVRTVSNEASFRMKRRFE